MMHGCANLKVYATHHALHYCEEEIPVGAGVNRILRDASTHLEEALRHFDNILRLY